MSDSINLVSVDEKTALAAFTSGTIDAILERIASEARAHVLDVTTPDGRKFIGSLAHKVARSKTALDDMGKDLVSDWKKQAKVVDVERKKARDFLDDLKTEIRQPLTDFEEQEKARIDRLERRVADLQLLGDMPHDATAADLKTRRNSVKVIELGTDWQEYAARATEIKEEISHDLATRIIAATKREEEAAELARLREEAAERQRKEAEDKIRAEAAEKAKREAEAEAKAAAEKVERVRRAEEERARLQAETLQREKAEAIAQAKAAERAASEAATNERRRIEAEKEEEAEAARQREANRQHRAKINRAAAKALELLSLSDDQAKKVVTHIAEGKVPNVTISY